MKIQLEQVRKFHEAFGLYTQRGVLINPPKDVATLRKSLIEEETKEVVEELEKDDVDMQALAKELADLLYVTYGTIVSFGLQQYMEDVFDEVHASNMSKLGRDGKPIHREDGKALKGPDYFKADMTKIFE